MLLDLTDADRGNPALMRAMDRINACWGRGTLPSPPRASTPPGACAAA